MTETMEEIHSCDALLREAYGAIRVLLLAADVLDITEPAHAEVASAIETDLLDTFRRIEKYVTSHPSPSDVPTTDRELAEST